MNNKFSRLCLGGIISSTIFTHSPLIALEKPSNLFFEVSAAGTSTRTPPNQELEPEAKTYVVFSGLKGLMALCNKLDRNLTPRAKEWFGDAGSDAWAMQFGRVCGAKVAVFSRPDHHYQFNEFTDFVGYHEWFHLNKQYDNIKIPLELAGRHGLVPNSFFENLARSAEGDKQARTDATCTFIDDISELPQPMRRSVFWTIAFEWPAEKYAYARHIQSGGQTKSYLASRSRWTGIDRYIASITSYGLLARNANAESVEANGLVELRKLYELCQKNTAPLDELWQGGSGTIKLEEF